MYDESNNSSIYVGGISSMWYGPENCINTGNITIEKCSIAELWIGGIQGYGEHAVLNNLNLGNININQCFSGNTSKIYIRRN